MAGEGDDEEIVTGTEGEGTEGADAPERDEDSEVPAEHPDDQEDDGEQVDAQPERPTRGQSRIQRLANEAKAAREEAAAARREAEEARREARQGQQFQSREQHEARRALMTPEERIADDMQGMQRGFDARLSQMHMDTQNRLDRSAYEAKAATNQVYAKYQDAVEERFEKEARKGAPVEREVILKFLIGEAALSGASNPKAKKAAKGRVESQRVSPSSGKGDTQSNRGKAGDTPASRLKDVFI